MRNTTKYLIRDFIIGTLVAPVTFSLLCLLIYLLCCFITWEIIEVDLATMTINMIYVRIVALFCLFFGFVFSSYQKDTRWNYYEDWVNGDIKWNYDNTDFDLKEVRHSWPNYDEYE
jgi:ethanolamine transporter EutH